MHANLILSLFSIAISSVLAAPGARGLQHHHHAKRQDDGAVVYATVQVTQYVTLTAGQSATPSPNLLVEDADGNVGNVATAAVETQSSSSSTSLASVDTPTTFATSTAPSTSTPSTPASTTPSSSTSVSTTSSTTSAASGTKKGLAWPSANPTSYESIFTSSALDWYFNWGQTATSGLSLTFVHQQWGSDNLGDLANVPQGSTVLGFNEPDGTTQATMSAAQAAALYLSDFTPLRKTGQIAYLGTPSITNGASGITWLTEFMSACADCEIDFVSAHWYGPDLALFQSQISTIHTTFNLPVWVTEMACTNWVAATNPTASEISAFMTSSIQWMEDQSWLEKYAWFGALEITDTTLGADNMLITSDGTALSSLGELYLSL